MKCSFCSIVFLLATLLFLCAQACDISADATKETTWDEQNDPVTTYNIILSSPCVFTYPVTISISWDEKCALVNTWGYSAATGQVFRPDAGFTLSGDCTPQLNVTDVSKCECDGQHAELKRGTPVQYINIGLKFLILACTADIRLDVAKQTLESVGSLYDVICGTALGSANFSLTNADGSGKYSSVVTTTDTLCWTESQQAQLQEYEIRFNVKVVILYTYPYPSSGVTTSGSGSNLGGVLTFSTKLSSVAKSIPSNVSIPFSGVYSYPAVVTNASLASVAVTATYTDGSVNPLACFVTYPDGRRHLEFYIDQATWALYPVVLGNAWLDWVSNGLFIGLRRLEVNGQIDDVFMATGTFDPLIGGEGSVVYRITTSDLQKAVAWQKDFNARLPAGSHFVWTFAFNGATVIENGGYTKDPLYLGAKPLRDNFFWETHTYTHPYLDDMTYADVKDEFTKNNVTALALYDNKLSNPSFAPTSCITPSISGLFNGEALRAIYDVGIRNVVGDNSRGELLPANPYHGIITSVAVHGFAGIYIVPRHANDIYYDCSLPAHIVSEYNFRYSVMLKHNFTFEEVIDSNVGTQTKLLLSYRMDPFMFHQNNLRSFLYNNQPTSLISYWAERLAASLKKYTILPIMSHNHDKLAQLWRDRETRDACGASVTLKIDPTTHAIVGLSATSTQSCKLAVTGGNSSQVTNEKYGPDTTMWLNMAPNVVQQITFTAPIQQS